MKSNNSMNMYLDNNMKRNSQPSIKFEGDDYSLFKKNSNMMPPLNKRSSIELINLSD